METEFHQKILSELSFLKGQLSESLPTIKIDINTLKNDVALLKEDSIFKKGKTVGISVVVSMIISTVGWFIGRQ